MLDPDFVADCPYGPEGQLLDAVLLVDHAQSLVRARMPTHDELPITRSQRAHPALHPRHVSGGLMIHMTGIMGFAHAFYICGLRHREGWVGYGARIHNARFHALARPGEPLVLEIRATQLRIGSLRGVGRYTLRFHQGDTLVYEGDQTAWWQKIDPEAQLTT
ncbi:MAG: hypothetical protein HY909_07720 [Deltaproteobacteria bacterium]|nr:hypothetical protein [Deltaproteobacteria bacterium]